MSWLAIERSLKAVPDWGWIALTGLFVIAVGLAYDVDLYGHGSDTPWRATKIALIICGFFAYIWPGLRLARYVKSKMGERWGDEIGRAVGLAWIGVPALVLRIVVGPVN